MPNIGDEGGGGGGPEAAKNTESCAKLILA